LPSRQNIELALSDPPEGMVLQNVKVASNGLAFQLKVDGDAAKAGYRDNLIVEAFTQVAFSKKGAATKQKRRVSLGPLPAIPFEIVQP